VTTSVPGVFYGRSILRFGRGSRSFLPAALHSLKVQRPALVVDAGLAGHSIVSDLGDLLRSQGIPLSCADPVFADPTLERAEHLCDRIIALGADGVVAIGGGSAIDAGKAAAMLARNPGPAASFIGRDMFASPPLPLIAMPTTCGTGSEVTWVSVLNEPSIGRKLSLKGVGMFPAVAIVRTSSTHFL